MRKFKLLALTALTTISLTAFAENLTPTITISSSEGVEICPGNSGTGYTTIIIANTDSEGSYTYNLQEDATGLFTEKTNITNNPLQSQGPVNKILSPGTYYYRVKATNQDDDETYTSNTLTITVYNVLDPGYYSVDSIKQGKGFAEIEVLGAKGSGNGELKYHWYKYNGGFIPSEDIDTEKINVLTDKNTQYACYVNDGCYNDNKGNQKTAANKKFNTNYVQYEYVEIEPGELLSTNDKRNETICKGTTPEFGIKNEESASGASGEFDYLWLSVSGDGAISKYEMKYDTIPSTEPFLTANDLAFLDTVTNKMVTIIRKAFDKQYPEYNSASTYFDIDIVNIYYNLKLQAITAGSPRVGDVIVLKAEDNSKGNKWLEPTYSTKITGQNLDSIYNSFYSFNKDGENKVFLTTTTNEYGCKTYDTLSIKVLPKLTETIHDTTIVTKKDTITLPVHDTITVTKNDTITLTKTDTVTITKKDTVTITKKDTVTITKTDTLTLTKTDTIFKIDTIYVTDTVYIEVPETDVTSKKTKVTLYPNPAVDYVNIDCEEPTAVALINENGNVLKRSESAYNHDLDITEYPAGIYFIKTEDAVFKFIKK